MRFPRRSLTLPMGSRRSERRWWRNQRPEPGFTDRSDSVRPPLMGITPMQPLKATLTTSWLILPTGHFRCCPRLGIGDARTGVRTPPPSLDFPQLPYRDPVVIPVHGLLGADERLPAENQPAGQLTKVLHSVSPWRLGGSQRSARHRHLPASAPTVSLPGCAPAATRPDQAPALRGAKTPPGARSGYSSVLRSCIR